jgi:GTP-binding protein
LDTEAEEGLDKRVQEQSRTAIDEADAILFLLDGKNGLSPIDRDAIDQLRAATKPVFYAVNKLDTLKKEENLYEFYALGLERLFPISAEHGLGIAELMTAILAVFPEETASAEESQEEPDKPLCIVIVGRPNAGKSTLTNRLLGFERSVVDPMPGTTRDALDSPFELNGLSCILVDTAGMRRKARIDDQVEGFSVKRTLRVVDRADLVIHLIDATQGVTDQDAQILAYAFERGKALLLAINKWDLALRDEKDAEAYRAEVYYNLSFLEHVPVLFISAVSGFGVRKMLVSAVRLLKAYERKISTSALNQALQAMVKAHPAPLNSGRPVKFYYGTQTGTRPPTFTFFVNSPGAVAESYRRYLTHQLRENLALDCAPIKIFLRPRREELKSKKH